MLKQRDKYETDITSLRQELTNLKVDGTLLATASARNAVNPEQVAQLLKGSVGLDETGRPSCLIKMEISNTIPILFFRRLKIM